MKLAQEQMDRLKAVEKELLKSFISVCEKLNLKYYLLGGTLLGAVRHKGFIPWDDDIDVGMPRADYEIFIKEGQKYLPEEYFIQARSTEPDFHACFAKIRNSKTTFLETPIRHFKVNHGVFIDIFPLDFCSSDPKVRKRQKRRINLCTMRIANEFFAPQRRRTLKSGLISLALKLRYPDYRKAVKSKEDIYKLCDTGEFLANFGGAWGEKEIVPAEWYAEGCDLEFEGLVVKAPKEYEKWLTQVYGDYMKLPPVEKRVIHHCVDVIDVDKPYTEYTNK